jgi:tetratricopeptide (TPR) repeat protein
MNRPLCTLVALSLAAAAVTLPSPAAAQQPPARGSTANPADATTTAAPQGLDALGDDRLLSELAGRNLTGLLERAFQTNDVAPDRRAAVLARVAFTTLRTQGPTMSPGELDRLVAQAASAVVGVLPSMDDPAAILEDVTTLLVFGVQRDLNVLEYWGENPRTQGKLKPVVEAIVQMCTRAEELARARADQLAEAIRSQSDVTAIRRWQQADTLAETAAYTGHIVRYYRALSLDKADPQRLATIREAAEYLEQFDVDGNPDRAFVRTLLGKLATTRGGEEGFAEARRRFDEVIAEPLDPQNPAAQFEARYFRARVEVEARQVGAARQQNESLDGWTAEHLPGDPGVQAADMMLEYRIHSLEAELAGDPATTEAANRNAVATLVKLVEAQPSLRRIVFEQLVSRLPSDVDVSTLDPLLLEAMLDRGRTEATKDTAAPLDQPALARAIAAAGELIARGEKDASLARQAELASFVLPFMLERSGDALAAANAYLDHVARHPGNPQNASVAMTNAEVRLAELRRTRPDDPAVGALEDRLLPVAVAPPFSRTDLLFRHGYRLQQKGQSAEAIAIYRRLPASDPNFASSRYLLMVLLNAQLAEMPADDPRRATQVQEVLSLADAVTTDATASLASARNDREQAILRARLVGTKILAADIAQAEAKDPQRALNVLADIEREAQSLPNAGTLLGEALNVRVRAMRDLGRLSEAAEQLKRLTETGGEAGVASVVDLLRRLDEDYDRAYARSDRDAMRRIAASRAMLTPELVKWASNSPKPEHRKFVYRYTVLDADSQRLAAELTDDPAEQKRLREAALARYESLETAENFQSFLESLPAMARVNARYDPSVVLGIARLHYELGNHPQALSRLQRLLEDRAVGAAIVKQNRGGVEVEVDNDTYWEVITKFIRSNLAVDPASREEMARFLKVQFVTWRDRTGGTRWKTDLQSLLSDLAPGWSLPPATTTPSP